MAAASSGVAAPVAMRLERSTGGSNVAPEGPGADQKDALKSDTLQPRADRTGAAPGGAVLGSKDPMLESFLISLGIGEVSDEMRAQDMDTLVGWLELGRTELLSRLRDLGLTLPQRQKLANALAKSVKAHPRGSEASQSAAGSRGSVSGGPGGGAAGRRPTMPPPPASYVDRQRRKSSGGSSTGGSTKTLGRLGGSGKLPQQNGIRQVPATRAEIVLFGDSITQCAFQPEQWGSRLANFYQRTADVVLRGYNGYNTQWALQLLPQLFPLGRTAPSLIVIQFGTNDAARPPPVPGHLPAASRQHVPIADFEMNLISIVNAIHSCGNGSARVLLLTPLPVDEGEYIKMQRKTDKASAGLESIRTNAHTGKYADAVMRVALRLAVPVLDLWREMQMDRGWRKLLRDGLHPNDKGAFLIFSLLKRAISAYYREMLPSSYEDPDPRGKLQLDFPDHKSIQADQVEVENWFRLHAEARAAGRPVPRTEKEVHRPPRR